MRRTESANVYFFQVPTSIFGHKVEPSSIVSFLSSSNRGIRSMESQEEKTIVGYALKPKKIKSFLQPKFQDFAMKKGIFFVEIDQNSPLSDQPPFHILIHKISGKEWRQVLEEYSRTHPEVIIVDPPEAVQHLQNRQSMLQCVADVKLNFTDVKLDVPKQVVIEQDMLSIPQVVAKAGLKMPVVVKPLVSDGSANSHELFLAYDDNSLQKLEPPTVLQEFINHGGVLFKVYVAGSTMTVVKRFSLPDVCKQEFGNNSGVVRLSRVSSAVVSADDADLDPDVAELPPQSLLEKLAEELRSRLGLRLFNFDVIRKQGTEDQFYVLDINYFPGYEKLPDYEHIFTDFLLSLVHDRTSS